MAALSPTRCVIAPSRMFHGLSLFFRHALIATSLLAQTIGFVFVGVLIFQDLLGLWSHLNYRAPGPGRPPPPRAAGSWIHILLGVSLIVTGVCLYLFRLSRESKSSFSSVQYYQVFLGMERYGVSEELVTYGYYGCACVPV